MLQLCDGILCSVSLGCWRGGGGGGGGAGSERKYEQIVTANFFPWIQASSPSFSRLILRPPPLPKTLYHSLDITSDLCLYILSFCNFCSNLLSCTVELFNYHALLVYQFDVERKIKDKTSFYGITSPTFCLACYIFVNKALLFWQVLLSLHSGVLLKLWRLKYPFLWSCKYPPYR